MEQVEGVAKHKHVVFSQIACNLSTLLGIILIKIYYIYHCLICTAAMFYGLGYNISQLQILILVLAKTTIMNGDAELNLKSGVPGYLFGGTGFTDVAPNMAHPSADVITKSSQTKPETGPSIRFEYRLAFH